MYDLFSIELKNHAAHGYHEVAGKVAASDQDQILQGVNPDYCQFLRQIGYGSYFSGALVIFSPLQIAHWTQRLIDVEVFDKLAIGYNGTTEGCFAILKSGGPAIYWVKWLGGQTVEEASSFVEWIESRPKALYHEKIYSAYKKIKDIPSFMQILGDRASVAIRLVSYEKRLSKKRGEESALLARYNKITVGILISAKITIQTYTIKCYRTKSAVGDDNVAYVSVPIDDLPVGQVIEKDCYVFDPFNLPFEDLIVDSEPMIDISKPSKAMYVELAGVL